MFSSPFELQRNRLPDEQRLAAGNAPFLQSQLILERQKQKINEMENHIRVLEIDVMTWKARFTTAQ